MTLVPQKEWRIVQFNPKGFYIGKRDQHMQDEDRTRKFSCETIVSKFEMEGIYS